MTTERYRLVYCREMYQRLVIDANSLLPHCEMPVGRLLFEEWLNETLANNAELVHERSVQTTKRPADIERTLRLPHNKETDRPSILRRGGSAA